LNKIQNTAGIIFIVVGIIGGVLAASRDPIHGSLFFTSLSFALIGIVLRKLQEDIPGTDVAESVAQIERTRSDVDPLLAVLRELSEGLESKTPDRAAILKSIESLLLREIPVLISSANELEASLGKTRRAMIVSLISEGERYLNRTWSALSDGYENEAKNSLSTAREKIEEAQAGLPSSGSPVTGDPSRN
jgi:hypothetical protein